MTAPPSGTPAGWYRDYADPDRERLYDGYTWTDATRPPRGRFAARYAHRAAGIWLAIVGALFALTLPGSLRGLIEAPSAGAIVGFLFLFGTTSALGAASTYLLRGRGENPAAAAARGRARAEAEQVFRAAVDNLAAHRSGGAGLVARRYLDQTAADAYGPEGPARASAAADALGIDPRAFDSPRLGYLAVLGSPDWFEVFADWIIHGYVAHDVDEHTRMSVFLDGNVQIVANQVTRNGFSYTENSSVDMRQAAVQVVSDTWSIGVPIDPAGVNEARRIAEQLASRVRRLAPRAASAADIRSMVDAILGATGQPIAEKIKQLSNLRYDRILSDEDFESAKARLLANPGGGL